MIPLGVLCYFVGVHEFPNVNGRVVEVVGYAQDETGVWWHVVTAKWADEEFGGREVHAGRDNLRPISAPGSGGAEHLPEKLRIDC